MTSDLLGLAAFLAVCFAAASSGAFFRPGAWYRSLRKPAWTPPNWLFAPAWTVLYILIAISGWLVWRKTGLDGAPAAIAAYGFQLAFNAGWSAVFFGMRRPDLALFEIAALWLSIALTIGLFIPIDTLAALLLAPYLAWVTFAATLNFSVWRLNRA